MQPPPARVMTAVTTTLQFLVDLPPTPRCMHAHCDVRGQKWNRQRKGTHGTQVQSTHSFTLLNKYLLNTYSMTGKATL